MADPELLDTVLLRHPGHQAAPQKSTGHGSTSGALNEIAVPRLRALAVVFAGIALLFALGGTLAWLGVLELPGPLDFHFLTAILTFALFASIAMWIVTRLDWPARSIINFGLAFQWFGALCIAAIEEHTDQPHRGMSIVCLWILTFTLVPQKPRRAALALYGAAFASPIAYALTRAAGFRDDPIGQMHVMELVGNLVGATIALFTNAVIYKLGRQVVDARELGAYTLVEELGHGGMGEVWRAEHRSLIRPAAIKLVRAQGNTFNDAQAVRTRFEREVQATALLTSPHTVAIYDFGSADDGRMYYVMELLSGLDFESMIGRFGPVPAERVVYLIRQVCESLAEAHANGLVHRDVKPANLYACTIGGKSDFVKVLDFGLVHTTQAPADSRVTTVGQLVGTPAYLAPETVAHNITDPRSDIYSLGCVAYYMLTGHVVFEAQTSAATMAAQLHETPTPPSARTELYIPPQLEHVVLRCLAKDPAERPQTADEVRQRLDQVHFPQRWSQERARKWWQTNLPDVLARAKQIGTVLADHEHATPALAGRSIAAKSPGRS
ncbi:MAG: serine/threonine-protein kinase [Kofleriaceae bacterium]